MKAFWGDREDVSAFFWGGGPRVFDPRKVCWKIPNPEWWWGKVVVYIFGT